MTPFVPGDGPGTTGIVIVGRDPGAIEVREGRPFVGQAGCLLNRELGDIGIDRSSVHITNTVLCHTEGNKKPSVRAVQACHDRLIREIKQTGAKKVLVLGETALRALTDRSGAIDVLRLAGPLRSPFLGDDVAVRVTYHPAWVWRNWKKGHPPFASDIGTAPDSVDS
jgi:DNA polymerase